LLSPRAGVHKHARLRLKIGPGWVHA